MICTRIIWRKGWIHPNLQIVLVPQIAGAARNLINIVPQTAATTFAFSSVYILLLCLHSTQYCTVYTVPSDLSCPWRAPDWTAQNSSKSKSKIKGCFKQFHNNTYSILKLTYLTYTLDWSVVVGGGGRGTKPTVLFFCKGFVAQYFLKVA